MRAEPGLDALFASLRDEGFRVGVDEELRVRRVLGLLGEQGTRGKPASGDGQEARGERKEQDELAAVVASIVVKSAEARAKFDEVFDAWAVVQSKRGAEPEPYDGPLIPLPAKRRRWSSFAWPRWPRRRDSRRRYGIIGAAVLMAGSLAAVVYLVAFRPKEPAKAQPAVASGPPAPAGSTSDSVLTHPVETVTLPPPPTGAKSLAALAALAAAAAAGIWGLLCSPPLASCPRAFPKQARAAHGLAPPCAGAWRGPAAPLGAHRPGGARLGHRTLRVRRTDAPPRRPRHGESNGCLRRSSPASFSAQPP